MKDKILSFLQNSVSFIIQHKLIFSSAAIFTALSVTATSIVITHNNNAVSDKPGEKEDVSSIVSSVIEEVSSEETVSSEESVSSEQTPTVKPTKKPTATVTTTPAAPTVSGTDYKYNTNTDPNNNVFLDALIYTGYNIEKHRADGNMWKYVLAGKKRGLGYLSKIGYSGGSTGYETNASGKPDIAKFERSGLVCASFATYVYFNYLPNVAGIDTSSLTRPKSSVFAHDWYTAVKDWVAKGYSEYIPFKSTVTGATGNSFIKFYPSREIPIGSVIIFRNPKKAADYGSHVAIYAGTVNDYHWLLHVGTSNGPEFCAVERMNFGPNPRWPIAIVTPPSNIRFSPVLEIELKDDSGAPISGAKFSLKKAGGTTDIGTTDASGKLTKSGLLYGEYELIETVPSGYTSATVSQKIKLTTLNNSYNKISITNIKDKPPVEETPEPVPEEPTPTPDTDDTPNTDDTPESEIPDSETPDSETPTLPETPNKKPEEGTDHGADGDNGDDEEEPTE